MISKLFKFLKLVFILFAAVFLLAQVWHIYDVLNKGLSFEHINLPNYDLFSFIRVYSFKDFNDLKNKIIFTIIIIILVYLFIYIFLGYNLFNFQDARLNSYQRKNYHHLQNFMERKRGLHRMQYDRKGNITEKTLEHFLEVVLHPLYILQNSLMRYYHKPRYRFWNLRTTKDHQQYLLQLNERNKELEKQGENKNG